MKGRGKKSNPDKEDDLCEGEMGKERRRLGELQLIPCGRCVASEMGVKEAEWDEAGQVSWGQI